MSYEQLEEIGGRKQEKIFLFLTIENLGGLLCLGLPVYIATGSWPFFGRMLVVAIAATAGVGCTLDIGGMALYARMMWQLRGLIRRASGGGGRISPDQLAGQRVVVRDDRALRANGPIRLTTAPKGGQRTRNAHALAVPRARPALGAPPEQVVITNGHPTGQADVPAPPSQS